MKKLWTMLLLTAMLAALTAPACADVLWEPENSFYEKYHDDCEYLGRRYMVNSPDGFITVWDAPDGSRVLGQFTNGTKLWVYWLYENWGIIAYYGEEETVEGWVDMNDMILLYDHTAFAEDYADQIRPYNGEFADYDGDAIVCNFYEYPGAGAISDTRDLSNSGVRELLTGSKDEESYISEIFVDENGLTWGYVNYLHGQLRAWFCLDDPDGVNDENQTDFPLREITYENQYPAKEPVLPKKAYLPYALVGGAVVLTAGVLVLFAKKKKRG